LIFLDFFYLFMKFFIFHPFCCMFYLFLLIIILF